MARIPRSMSPARERRWPLGSTTLASSSVRMTWMGRATNMPFWLHPRLNLATCYSSASACSASWPTAGGSGEPWGAYQPEQTAAAARTKQSIDATGTQHAFLLPFATIPVLRVSEWTDSPEGFYDEPAAVQRCRAERGLEPRRARASGLRLPHVRPARSVLFFRHGDQQLQRNRGWVYGSGEPRLPVQWRQLHHGRAARRRFVLCRSEQRRRSDRGILHQWWHDHAAQLPPERWQLHLAQRAR